MKIRTQLNLLIIALIAIPLLSAITLPLYHYTTSPQRYLLKGYEQIRELDHIKLNDNEWDLLREKLESVPPNVQVAVFYNSAILISNIPELKVGIPVQFHEIFDLVRETSNIYDYQIQSPNITDKSTKGNSLIVISRSKIKSDNKHSLYRYMLPSCIILLGVEVFMIMLILQLSKTITKSISLLEGSCQKIANGELDTIIETPRHGKNSNEITSLATNLDKLRASLKDDQQRRTKFIMGISHDLRTPVALIKGYCEAISDGVVNDPDSIKDSLAIINTKATQLESMIGDLIDYAKLNNTEWLHTLKLISIKEFMEEFCSTAQMTTEFYKRNFSYSVEIDESIKVPMDKGLFTRALENLFNNAVRYSNENDSISIKTVKEDSLIKIYISDTGVGMTEEDKEHLYDLFYRGTASRREQGMGIGLSVVKTITDSHGWKIDVDSKKDEGTTFTITIDPCKKC